MKPKNKLREWIETAIHERYSRSAKSGPEMRDECYAKDLTYREAEDEAGPTLQRDGANRMWMAAVNHDRTKLDEDQFSFADLPNSEDWGFEDLKRRHYVPVGSEEEEVPEGKHLAPEDMVDDELQLSEGYYLRLAKNVEKRAYTLRQLREYRKAMHIPKSMTIRQWWEKKGTTGKGKLQPAGKN